MIESLVIVMVIALAHSVCLAAIDKLDTAIYTVLFSIAVNLVVVAVYLADIKVIIGELIKCQGQRETKLSDD